MCGIFAAFHASSSKKDLRTFCYQQSRLQRHRGPDNTGVISSPGATFVHERLSIIGLETGTQPFVSQSGKLILVANAEIYNYRKLAEECSTPLPVRSDCDVILSTYEKHGLEAVNFLRGMFAFVLQDVEKGTIYVARDPYGIIPMYQGIDKEGTLYFSSEMKCLKDMCVTVESFPPGVYRYGPPNDLKEVRFYQPSWIAESKFQVDIDLLRLMFESSVESHMQCDTTYAALLSGGVDSSLVASVAARFLMRQSGEPLRTYSVGLKDAPDFYYSRMVAKAIGSIHKEHVFTIQEGLDAIREVIWHLESYDVTTIRAGIPMYLLARRIKRDGVRMVLSGEGADEIFGGYLYFHKAPNPQAFHDETVSRVFGLHLSDCLRANKAMLAWGVELRVPFLDKVFVDHSMSIRPEDRMVPSQADPKSTKLEKFIIRQAFSEGAYLPDEVLWRQKEQFSDGVGYGWIDSLRDYSSSQVSDEDFEKAPEIFEYNTPQSKEAFYYRTLFSEMFGSFGEKTVNLWIPRKDWGCSTDPSGRAQAVHVPHTALEPLKVPLVNGHTNGTIII